MARLKPRPPEFEVRALSRQANHVSAHMASAATYAHPRYKTACGRAICGNVVTGAAEGLYCACPGW